MKKYSLVGGNPFRGYNGTTYTGLRVIGNYDTKQEAQKAWDENYEKCAGLMLILESDAQVQESPW